MRNRIKVLAAKMTCILLISTPTSQAASPSALGYDRLFQEEFAASPCELTEDDVLRMFPEMGAAYADDIYKECISEKVKSGQPRTDCNDGDEIAARWATSHKPAVDIPYLEKPQLNFEAKKRFSEWKKKQICIDIPKVKEVVSAFHQEAEEICRSKGLAAIPPYAIFKAAKNNPEISDGAASSDVVPHWSADLREANAELYGIKKGAEAATGMKDKAPPASSTSTTESEKLTSGKVLEQVATGEHTTGTLTTTTGSRVDYIKVEQIVKVQTELAIKYPELTGAPPNYECKGDKCKSRSNGEEFPKKDLQQKLGCVGKPYSCRLDTNFDPKDIEANCISKEDEKLLIESSKFTRDPDAIDFEKDDPNDALARGNCDSSYFGNDFCKNWKMQAFRTEAQDFNIERKQKSEAAARDLEDKGLCNYSVFGNTFCHNFMQKQHELSECQKDPSACEINEPAVEKKGKDSAIILELPQFCRDALKKGAKIKTSSPTVAIFGSEKPSISELFPPGLKGREQCISVAGQLALKGVDLDSLWDFLITGTCQSNNFACIPDGIGKLPIKADTKVPTLGRHDNILEGEGFKGELTPLLIPAHPKGSGGGFGEIGINEKFGDEGRPGSPSPFNLGSSPATLKEFK